MLKFKKNYTYLVKGNSYWYVVQQQSQRGWEGVIFSHYISTINPNQDKHLHNNAEGLFKTFQEMDGFEVVECGSNKELRKNMFSILETGKACNE